MAYQEFYGHDERGERVGCQHCGFCMNEFDGRNKLYTDQLDDNSDAFNTLHQLSTLGLANSRARRRRNLGCERQSRTPRDSRSSVDNGVLCLRLGRCGLEIDNDVRRILILTIKQLPRQRGILTAVMVLTTCVTPWYLVVVETLVTVVTRSTVTTIVLGAAVVQTVDVCHLVVSGSLTVTVLLSRPRFSIVLTSARRAERAARKAARSSIAGRKASRRRRVLVGTGVGVELGAVSRAAACTKVGVMVAHGSR